MFLKKGAIILIAMLILIACGGPTVQTVARVDNVILTRQELDQRINRLKAGYQKQAQLGTSLPSDLVIERQLVGLFVDQNLVLSLAKQHGIAVSDADIDATIARFRDLIAQSAAQSGTQISFDEAVQNQLGLPGGDSTEFRQFASYVVAQQKLSETLVTTDTVRQQVTDQVMAEANRQVMKANVAHILIGVPQNADEKTDADAKTKAEDLIARLNKGEKFEDLAKEFSEDPGSKDNGGLYEGVVQGQMVPEFDKATFEDLKPGEITQTPVKTQFGYHIIKLVSREEEPAMTPEQAQQTIEMQIGQQLQQARQQEFQQLLSDEHAQAQKDGRLVEPTYPDPTAEPTTPPAEQPTVAPAQ